MWIFFLVAYLWWWLVVFSIGAMYSLKTISLHGFLSDKAEHNGLFPSQWTWHDPLHSDHTHKQTAAETETTLWLGGHCCAPRLRVSVVVGWRLGWGVCEWVWGMTGVSGWSKSVNKKCLPLNLDHTCCFAKERVNPINSSKEAFVGEYAWCQSTLLWG